MADKRVNHLGEPRDFFLLAPYKDESVGEKIKNT
jgi:hypothetical protein